MQDNKVKKMLRIGITGQAGFVGTHLYNTLGLHTSEFTRIPFEDHYFESRELLEEFLETLKEDHLEALIRRVMHVPVGQKVRVTKAMADALTNLAEDSAKREQFGQKSLEFAQDRLSLERMLASYVHHYLEIRR